MSTPTDTLTLTNAAGASGAIQSDADWAARNQIRDAWPAWDANKGRFPYHILIDPAQRAKQPQAVKNNATSCASCFLPPLRVRIFSIRAALVSGAAVPGAGYRSAFGSAPMRKRTMLS
jgi:hypothetical protein